MKFLLCDLNKKMVDAWKNHLYYDDDVSIHHNSIFNLECDAIVSPANSFGFMDGGVDLLISKFFGWAVQKKLQNLIKTKWHGELLVGQAEIVKTNHHQIPYVISAPTMRIPTVLELSVNPYLATRAVILLIQHGTFPDKTPIKDCVKSVAFTGMGTGVGHLPYESCAIQMKKAIDDFYYGKYKYPKHFADATRDHCMMSGDYP